MLDTTRTPQGNGTVTALFEDGPHSFILAMGTTLAVLSRRLAALRRQHHGKLLDVTVRPFTALSFKVGTKGERIIIVPLSKDNLVKAPDFVATERTTFQKSRIMLSTSDKRLSTRRSS